MSGADEKRLDVSSDAARGRGCAKNHVAPTGQSGFGYIKLTLWKSPVHKDFKRALENITSDSPGIIIDLRGNPGGEASEVIKIAKLLFQFAGLVRPVRLAHQAKRSISTRSGTSLIYKGPVVILVNEGSGSGSELFSGVMQESGRATVIGRQKRAAACSEFRGSRR